MVSRRDQDSPLTSSTLETKTILDSTPAKAKIGKELANILLKFMKKVNKTLKNVVHCKPFLFALLIPRPSQLSSALSLLTK